jgi:hypothetical protein
MAVERSKERWRIVIGALVVLIGAAGCSWYSTGPKPPAQARVQVTGTGPLLIITSEAFDRTVNDSTGVTEMVLYQADTATSSLPFDSAYDVAPSDRFLVRVVNPDTVPRDVQVQVYFDGDLKFDRSATLTNASIQYSRFF